MERLLGILVLVLAMRGSGAEAQDFQDVAPHPGPAPQSFASAIEYEAFALGRMHQLRELERGLVRAGRPPAYYAQVACGLALTAAGLGMASVGFIGVAGPHHSDPGTGADRLLLTGAALAAVGAGWAFTLWRVSRARVDQTRRSALRDERLYWDREYRRVHRELARGLVSQIRSFQVDVGARGVLLRARF